jgi:pyruvate formate lyase activating enzyme
MHEASFYELIDPVNLTVRCTLCRHNCEIQNNKFGFCKVRQNINGKLISQVYGKLVSENSDPIEKKPIFHMMPGSQSYSIATVGCNFRCKHCQNHQISQYPKENPGQFPGVNRTPNQVVDAALQANCQSISYTYIEPTIFYEFAYETSVIAKENGLKNIFVSNGYTGDKAIKKIAPYIDANNIDLKAFSEKFYHNVCGAKLSGVLASIETFKEQNIWVEVTTLVIPGLNDSDQELRNIAEFLVSIDPNIPWHVSRFHPTFKMTDRPPTPSAVLLRAREIGLAAGLKYIYTGNIPGQGHENTHCPGCGEIVIERDSYNLREFHLKNNKCKFCNTTIAGIFM